MEIFENSSNLHKEIESKTEKSIEQNIECSEYSCKFKIAPVEPTKSKFESETLRQRFCYSFLSLNEDKKICKFGSTPFLIGIYQAYMKHCPLVFSPDDFWLLILQAFSNYVNKNSEKLRSLFVDFEGKKELKATIVKENAKYINDLCLEDFKNAINQLVNQIPKYIDEKLINVMKPDFSTTTEDIKYVGNLSIMSTFKNYFDFDMFCFRCGIPSVTLKGTVNDWEKLLEKLQKLRKYKLDEWVNAIEPILKKIIETRKGKLDLDFWKNMIGQTIIDEKIYRGCEVISTEKIDYVYGWILRFFPFDKNNKKYFNIRGRIKVKDMKKLATQILDVPFKLYFEKTQKTYDMIFHAGFLGMEQNDENYELSSVIGYYISQNNTDLDDMMIFNHFDI